jgi:arsenite methyltransferase
VLDGPHPRYLVEAGCGPGFYSRRLAARFPQLHITGIDLSEPLLCHAQQQAHRSGLNNCRFRKADALSLAESPGQIDAVIASRLFLILAQPFLALDAIFTALRPGGICFVAEPASALRASLPLILMRITERLGRSPANTEELPQSRVFTGKGFQDLIESQPWTSIRIWKDRQYHCAVCRKAA